MPLHLIKMCVGCELVEELRAFQADRLARGLAIVHSTKNTPRRAAEVLDGGSLYWVVKGAIQVRQRITGLEHGIGREGGASCLILLDPTLVLISPGRSSRPFQGWRYLAETEAPPDFTSYDTSEAGQLPPHLVKELKSLGLL